MNHNKNFNTAYQTEQTCAFSAVQPQRQTNLLSIFGEQQELDAKQFFDKARQKILEKNRIHLVSAQTVYSTSQPPKVWDGIHG
jgi:hypothetical protein